MAPSALHLYRFMHTISPRSFSLEPMFKCQFCRVGFRAVEGQLCSRRSVRAAVNRLILRFFRMVRKNRARHHVDACCVEGSRLWLLSDRCRARRREKYFDADFRRNQRSVAARRIREVAVLRHIQRPLQARAHRPKSQRPASKPQLRPAASLTFQGLSPSSSHMSTATR